MEVFDAVRTALAVRSYQDKPVPPELVTKIVEAQLAIVAAVDRTRFSVSDASRAIQSMILTAWAEGVGSNWVGFLPMPEINDLLGIPTELDVLAIVPFGYPARPVGKGKKRRKPLSEVAHRERFGTPFS